MRNLLQFPETERAAPWRAWLVRGVPQIVLGYATACWGVVQFIDWLSERYALAPALTDLVAATVVLVAPSVLLLAVYRTRPDVAGWSRAETFGVPINLVLAGIVLWVAFQGKELGFVNQTVTVLDRDGNRVERQVPKSAFRKRLALFFFDNRTGDPRYDWLRQGIVTALETDLSQDLYLTLFHSYDFADRIKRAGFGINDPLALGLAREIAGSLRLNYLVTGAFWVTGNRYTLRVDLYDRERLHRLSRRTYQGSEFFELVDQAALQLKRDVEVPETHIEQSVDYPVSEILTGSLAAFEAYSLARNASEFDQDKQRAAPLAERATQLDPFFAEAYVTQFNINIDLNFVQKSRQAAAQAERFSFKLSESRQVQFKGWKLVLEGKSEEGLQALQQWAALNPDDLRPLASLAYRYRRLGRYEQAIATYRRILEIDPEQSRYLLRIAEVEHDRGRFRESLAALKQYDAQQPNEERTYILIGSAQSSLGDLAAAEQSFRRALTVEPRSIEGLLGLAQMQMLQGRYGEAMAHLQKALRESQPGEERIDVHAFLADYFRLRGQPNKVLEQIAAEAFLKRRRSILDEQLIQVLQIDDLVQAGKPDRARALLQQYDRQSTTSPLARLLTQIGYLKLYLALGDAKQAEPLVAQVNRGLEAYGISQAFNIGRLEALSAQLAEVQGNHQRAIELFRQLLVTRSGSPLLYVDLGRNYRLLKDYKQADRRLKDGLKLAPAHPQLHFELAQVYAEQRDTARALAALEPVLAAWSEAEPEYAPARAARQLAAQLKAQP